MLLTSLNWNDLKFFLFVTRDGSLAKAAARLGVTHSTVFRRIQRLEDDLGMKLFSRLPEGYQLTSSGYLVLDYVEKTASNIDSLLRHVDNHSNRLSGKINISVTNILANSDLPNYIAEFRREYPSIEIELIVTDAAVDLSRNEADLAIQITTQPSKNLITHQLFSLNWSAFASAKYTNKYGIPENNEQLNDNHVIISGTGNLKALAAFTWLEKHIDPKNIVYRCNDLLSMSKAAETGIGICLLPDDQANPKLQRLMTLPNNVASNVCLLMHPDLQDCQRINLFKNYIIERLQSQPTSTTDPY